MGICDSETKKHVHLGSSKLTQHPLGTIALKPLAVINIRGTSSDGALRRSFETFGSKETSSRGTTFSDRPVPGTLAIAMARQFF